MSLRVQNEFTPCSTLEEANEKLRLINRFVFPRVAACSLLPIRRVLGLPDAPEMAIETRIELIREQNS